MDRRTFLKSTVALVTAGFAPAPKTKPLLIVYLDGGASQWDTVDFKPDWGENMRGPFGPLQTATPGVVFSDQLQTLAGEIDKALLLRGVVGESHDHYGAAQKSLWNEHRKTLARRTGHKTVGLPYAVVTAPPKGGGYENPAHQVYEALEFKWHEEYERYEASLPGNLDRPIGLIGLLEQLDSGSVQQSRWDSLRRLGLDLLTGGETLSQAADLPAGERERFGSTPFGDALLLARRLIDSGSAAVTVRYLDALAYDWHYNLDKQAVPILGALDRGLAALIADRPDFVTLVATEFGRTPGLKTGSGRNHWAKSMSWLLFGPGIRTGVYGSTDRRGVAVADGQLTHEQVQNTVLLACGAEIPPGSPREEALLH